MFDTANLLFLLDVLDTIAYPYPNIIDLDAVDFSECHSK